MAMFEEVRVQTDLKRFIRRNFLFGNAATVILDDTSLLDAGIMDSTGVLELVAYLEENYGLKVLDDEMVPENLDSIARMTAYLQRKLSASSARS